MPSYNTGLSTIVPPSAIYVFWSLLAACGVHLYLRAKRSPLNNIPTIGYSGTLTSYITAMEWTTRGSQLIQEGYEKFHGRPFKIATMSRWVVIISGKQCVNELCKAPDDVLSFDEPSIEATQGDYTLGPGLLTHPHHIATIRSSVTRNLDVKFEDIRDEVIESFKAYIPFTKEGWATVLGYETLLHIICRTINRYLIGLPLCRNPRYLFINEQFTTDTVNTAKIISMFPNILKPLVGKCLTIVSKRVEETENLLHSLIEERLLRNKTLEDSPHEQPNDVISWLIRSATKDYHLSVRDIVLRILIINFTAIHTSTMVIYHFGSWQANRWVLLQGLVQGVYDLATHPEYVQELREEIETVVAERGWSRDALQKMHKVDSFLKESFRLHNAAAFLMVRKTRKDWRLSDGTIIPPNVYIGVATEAMNKEEGIYQDASKFNGFRFVPPKLQENDAEPKTNNHHLVSLSSDYIVFGNGRHACPGRFLAASTVKTVFAHIVFNYDVQLENGSLQRPPNIRFGTSIIPNHEAKLMFRKRVEH